MSVLWRPEMNAMTTPPSYWARVIAKDSVGYRKLAEQIVLKNPVCSVDQAEAVLRARASCAWFPRSGCSSSVCGSWRSAICMDRARPSCTCSVRSSA